MINRISFKNYKIFKERQLLDIKPITVIIGKNNSGKSAVVKLPTLIESSLSTDSDEALNVNNNGVELGADLRDLVYGKANRVIEFELGRDDGECLSVGILVSSENNKQVSIIDSWSINKDFILNHTDNEDTYIEKGLGKTLKCEFSGLKLKKIQPTDSSIAYGDQDKDYNLLTDFIGPIRIQPLRDYRLISPTSATKFGIQGENSYIYLIEDALTTDKKLITKVADWYKQNFEGWEVKINQDKAPLFQIEIHRDDLKQNILDTGIGMSQVLPIVTRALMPCEAETLIIIEEPETHLHPAAHGNLASLFVESLSQGNKRYLIETHSLNFVLRLRRLVAEGKLSKDDIALYHVDFIEDNNFSTLERIDIDDLGRVSKWPEDIFNETLNETIAIRTAQIENSNNDN